MLADALIWIWEHQTIVDAASAMLYGPAVVFAGSVYSAIKQYKARTRW